jgi:GNAT superfamily N-acetyltransferase
MECSFITDVEEKIITLRQALFGANGRDKDVTSGIAPAFMKYERNGVSLEIEFSSKLTDDQADWAFELAKENMEEVYDASGYGWDDSDKMMELTEAGARFLLIRKKRLNFDDRPGDLVGFVHFRFTIQGEVMDQMCGDTSLHIWDFHLEEEFQRKGVGRHILTLLELIARREKIQMISIPIQLGDAETVEWIEKAGRGAYVPDETLCLYGFDPEMEVSYLKFKAMIM